MSEDGANMQPEIHAARERHQALAILRILTCLPGFGANDELLNDLLALYALDDSREKLREAFLHLEAAELLVTSDAPHGLVVVRLTERGEDAASGRINVDGVRRPGPGCAY